MELSQEKGASTWLTVLPIDDHGFALHKSAFRMPSFRYDWSLQNLPSRCSCSHPFSVEHALNCKTGGFPAVRHNEVRDISQLYYCQKSVMVLQQNLICSHSQGKLCHIALIMDDGACLDVAVYGFWGGRFEKAFLDVRVFNPSAQSNRRGPLGSVYRKSNMSSVCRKLNMPHLHHW